MASTASVKNGYDFVVNKIKDFRGYNKSTSNTVIAQTLLLVPGAVLTCPKGLSVAPGRVRVPSVDSVPQYRLHIRDLLKKNLIIYFNWTITRPLLNVI